MCFRYTVLAIAALACTVSAADLDALLANPKLWTLSQTDFEKLPETKGFRWTSDVHDSARAADREMKLYGMPVVEVVARFDANKVASVTALIYGRGDVGGIPEDKYKGVVEGATTAISNGTKTQFTVRGKDASNAVKAEGRIWQTPTSKYLLEYSFTKEVKTKNIPFRAEFVRLEVKPPEQHGNLLSNISLTGRLKFSGPAHVRKDPVSGDVLIPDVPMVDQGQKGYCAVACAERMMRYYGVQTDANEIAQIANSDAERGTSADKMFESLKRLGQRLKVRVQPVEQFEVKQILNLMADYNRVAKREKAPPIPDQGYMLNVEAIYRAMDKDILKEVRTKNKGEISRFQADVQKHIDQGIPLIWSVMLGVIKEPGLPQAYGGHMRLIIGYNSKTNEIMYTDSWGAGHELKRMAADDAWTMTTGLTAIEPSAQ